MTDQRAESLIHRATVTLERVRTEPQIHVLALLGSVMIGLALAWVHWLGLVAGGAAVGLISPTRTRALAGALGFGLLVLGVFVLSVGETPLDLLEMTPVVYATIGSAIGLPLLGSLISSLTISPRSE
ncbi:hypothetical protein [Natronolimnobius baerhuensis]|uniref:Uncharacterized protein n=1 Tax=Natronolimnobius baerhuensis TaxID=253108 RepID=A0A202ECF5_9EURY|nr:hypothetical protein [Natronolimnobius baerhuensis]OVE85909.1 hypothetical protein B2G88_03620 [Natronolimnobius baerhuensis]